MNATVLLRSFGNAGQTQILQVVTGAFSTMYDQYGLRGYMLGCKHAVAIAEPVADRARLDDRQQLTHRRPAKRSSKAA